MKYKELFTLHPITTVIQLMKADKKSEGIGLVERFVITQSLGESIEAVIVPQLNFESGVEGKGIFVVGNYGTGKSHLMSVLSLLAEDSSYLAYIKNDECRRQLESFAGNYKVKRCELAGTMMNLYQIITEQLQLMADICGFEFKFRDQREVSNVKDEFTRFMEIFDKKYPGKGVLLIIDELLEHLKSRDDQNLVLDLSILRALGEFCNGSRFMVIAGIQEQLNKNSEFNHISQEINRVHQRFNDIVIDNKGVKQLIEQYLFQKNETQRQQIRELMQNQTRLFEIVGPKIDQFVELFPAHPSFIDEFQQIIIVERREILKILSEEAIILQNIDIDESHPDLITADNYWKHIEDDPSLNTNRAVRKIKENVEVIKSKIRIAFSSEEEKSGAEKLVEALGVHRLTTPEITDPVGLTPDNLKNNLLWYSKITNNDPAFLTAAAKRLLDKTREAANGQYLTVSETTGQYYIDPSRKTDYDLDVSTAAKTISTGVIQRYLNEIITRELELNNIAPVMENRLWGYNLIWADRNVERPGWLFFGYPNQRSTANPPKDFYIFILPSARLGGKSNEDIPDKQDEIYWYFVDFPPCKTDIAGAIASTDPDTFLDNLRKYSAARQRAMECPQGDDQRAFDQISNKYRDKLLFDFRANAGDWIRVRFQGQNKNMNEWIQVLDPRLSQKLFKTQFDTISQTLFANHFQTVYGEYPSFPMKIYETSRQQEAHRATEILCETGMPTKNGRDVLEAFGLYKDDNFTPDQSPWLVKIQKKLSKLPKGHVINSSDIFEQQYDKWWWKGEQLEAEWLLIILAAGIREGDMILWGKSGKKYDATNLPSYFAEIKTHESISRIEPPSEIDLKLWRQLFRMFEIKTGLLANPNTYDAAMSDFSTKITETINNLIEGESKLQAKFPLILNETQLEIDENIGSIQIAKNTIEHYLQYINTKAKMQNLKIPSPDVEMLEQTLKIHGNLMKVYEHVNQPLFNDNIGVIIRSSDWMPTYDSQFIANKTAIEAELNHLYREPESLEIRKTDLDKLINALVNSIVNRYQELHKKHRLDKQEDKRKKDVLNGADLKALNRLVHINALNRTNLDDVIKKLVSLQTCMGCTDKEFISDPRSECPKCKFHPIGNTEYESSIDTLDKCIEDLSKLIDRWTSQLLSELDDPAVIGSTKLLSPEQQQLLQTFKNTGTLPSEISDSFINSFNSATRGLKRRPVKTNKFAHSIFGDGAPLKIDEIRERFENWLKAEVGQDEQASIRFVMEE